VPRQVSVRTNYREDSAYLIRFETAIHKDVDLPEEWRREFAQEVHRLAFRCMEADDIRNRRSDAKSDVRKSKR
jgi:hypothetical protein